MDKIFKIGLLVLGFIYLAYLFCPIANQAGRYQYREDSESRSVFDTSTGLLYIYALGVGGSVVDVITDVKEYQKSLKALERMEAKEAK